MECTVADTATARISNIVDGGAQALLTVHVSPTDGESLPAAVSRSPPAAAGEGHKCDYECPVAFRDFNARWGYFGQYIGEVIFFSVR